MERLVGLALSRFLSTYIKDFSAQQFKDWSLNDLHFKEDVIQDLIKIPNNLKLTKVTCDKIYAKIPWKNLSNEPIVLYANKVYIELEEPFDIPKESHKPPIQTSKPNKKSNVGFIDRILDNIKFEVSEIELKVKLLGKERSTKASQSPPFIRIQIKDIKVNSTNFNWEVVDLSKIYKVNEQGDVIMYKQVNIGLFSLFIEPQDGDQVNIIQDTPLLIRIKTKKEYFGGPLLNFSVNINVLNECNVSMHQQEFKAFEDVIDAIFECFGRTTEYEKPVKVNINEEEKVDNNVTSPKKPTMWSRFTEILGYRTSSNTEEEKSSETYDTLKEDSIDNTTIEEIQDQYDSDSDGEFFDCYEEIEDIPQETATLVKENEDVPFSEFILNINKGRLNIYEYVLGEHIGIASFAFHNFSCHFMPQLNEKFKSVIGFIPQSDGVSYLKSGNTLQQSKIKVTIDSYDLSILNPGPEHHPDYHTLVEKGSHQKESNMLSLHFQKVCHPENPYQAHKELLIEFDKVKIVFDVVIWENIYRFFFGSDKGSRLEQYISDNIDFIIQEAFSDQVHFLVSTKEPLIIIPPYAKRLSSKPHLASKVSFIHTKSLTFRSIESDNIPQEFSKSLFTKESFPKRDGDIVDCKNDDIILSNHFELQIQDAWLEIKPTPEDASEKVINPLDVRAIIIRNELKNGIRGKPNLDIYVTLSEIDVTMNQSQYSYLLAIWGEKLTWDPHNISAEMKEMILMEEALKAAKLGVDHFIANKLENHEEDIVLIRVNLYLHHTKISFLERTTEVNDSKKKYESIANIELPHATSVLELHQDKNVIKLLTPSFNMQAPYHKDSPFSSLISSSIHKDECLFFRMETYKSETPIPSKMWVKLDSVNICWIYSMLARILLFFISDEIPSEYIEEKVKEFIASYSFEQTPSLGMDWELEFLTSELIIVESPDTPECSPMEILNGELKRVAISESEIHYIFEGITAFHSKMWRDKSFQVEQLTKPFNMKALYIYSKDENVNLNSTKIQIDVGNIDIDISRNQLIMLQSILDNQLSDIRHTNAKSSTSEEINPLIYTTRIFFNSFQFNANKMNISLRDKDNIFSTMHFKGFSYSTENWSDIWLMDVECDRLIIKSTDNSLKFNLLQPRNKELKLKLKDNNEVELPHSSKLIRISYQSKNLEYKGNADLSKPWSSKWMIQLEPIDFLYDSEIVKSYQEFFSLMEEHKNLRKTYHRIQNEFNRIYGGDDTLDVETFQKIILNSREEVNDNQIDQGGMAINIVLKDPKILFPENRNHKLITLLELNMKRIRFGNDVTMLQKQPKGYSQFELNIKQAKLQLHSLRISKKKKKSIFDHLIQSHNLISPTNIRLDIKSKFISANRNPYVYLKAEMDHFIAMISLNRYNKIMGMINYYAEQFFQRFNSSSHEPDELLSTLHNPSEEIVFTDKNYEFTIKKVKITLVSDYMEESDLIFIKMNDLSVQGSIYKQYSNISIGGNLGITLNNLSYLKGEEKFINTFYFNLNFKIDHSSRIHELNGDAENDASEVVKIDQSLEDITDEESTLYIEFVVFSEVNIYLNKEILRHLFEVYNAYTASISEEKSNELNSHFQYIIVNNTDDDIIINQKKRKEKLLISPLEEKYFVFPDPRLPKDIEVKMKLWGKSNKKIPVDVQGSYKIELVNDQNISRDIYVIIEPSGLKRYIKFLSTHYITNETDSTITAHLIYPKSDKIDNVITLLIESGKRIPIPNSIEWEVECKIVFDDEYEQIRSIKLDRKRESIPITLYNVYDNTERTIIMSKHRDIIVDKFYTLDIIFSPPLLISNLTGFPLEFCFPDMNSIQNYQIDDDDSDISNNEYFGMIDSESEKPFYVSIQQLKRISFKLDGYDSWTAAISLRKEQVTSVEVSRKDKISEKNEKILLNVSITSRIDKLGRIIMVNLPFLLVNFSDMLISIKQPTSKKMVLLQPNQRKPFSWSKGSHELSVNVGNTRWSPPIQLGNNSYHRIEVDIHDGMFRTMILMETKVINEYSRVIIFKNWLNIQNSTSYDFKMILDYKEESEFNDSDFGTKNIFINKEIVIPKESFIQSCICPSLIGLTLNNDAWSTSSFSISENVKSILLLRNKLDNLETVAVDLEIKNEENGSFIILKENMDPPYIIYNNTPFGLNFRRYFIFNSTRSIGSIEPGSQKFNQFLKQKVQQKSDIFFIPPHESINMFDIENFDSENEVYYQVSVFIVEDTENDNAENVKDTSELSTSIHDPNFLKSRLKKSLSESTDAVKLKRSTSDLKKERQKAHYKMFFSDTKEKWSEVFSFNQAQSGFIVNFNDFYNDDVPNKLHVSLKPQGKTQSLTFSLPEMDNLDSIVAQEYQTILFRTTIPYIEIIFEEENNKKGIASLNINGIHAEYSKYSSSLEYFYLIFKEFDAYALFDSSEYPVLFIIDKSRLHGYHPNLLEFLMEWNVRDSRLFIEYLGIRVLPFILQIDGELITYFMDLYYFLFPSTTQNSNTYSTDTSYNERLRIIKFLKDLNSDVNNFTFDENNDDKNIYLGKLEIFPMKITLSVGSNDQHFPVISEARLSIDAFLRKNLNNSFNGLTASIGSHYTSLIWKKVYKIIGNMDIIASPVQNILKLKRGIVDFVVLPYEGLILDDTPGAFLVEFIKGTSSLLINLTDFFLTTFMKLNSSLSLLFQFVTFDTAYQKMKLNSSRRHPTNIFFGFVHGVFELSISIFHGVTDIFVLPYKETRDRGFPGFFIGIGKGIIGIPTKPIGGVFDLLSKTSEGALQSIGRGYIIQEKSKSDKRGRVKFRIEYV